MCGIAGIYRFDGQRAKLDLLKRMTDVISHRGPDDEGHHISNFVGLGNRRLSIIDLSPNGHQPMSNEDGTIWITFNGEIYNFQELKAELIQKGHQFRSNTDTEVMIHLYEDDGLDFLKKLRGMFAIAIWDESRNRLLLARDRLGIKPLFFYQDEEKFLFGSEIKCILEDESVAREVDLEALHHYLSLNYTPAPLTMFEGIRQLLPGQFMLIEKSNVKLNEYWDLQFESNGQGDEKEYARELDERLWNSVESMLVSDVPFGVFLSGGLVSSAVTYNMSQILKVPVKTFSIGFEEDSYNELEKARTIARLCGTEHHELQVKPDDLEILLPELVSHAEEPLADSSMIPVYYVSKLAHEHVKMVLCGDGADEILAGYETYQANRMARLYRAIPRFLRHGVMAPLVKALPVSDKKISFDYKIKRFVKGAEYSPEEAHFHWRIIFDEQEKQKLYSEAAIEKLNGTKTFDKTYAHYFQRANTSDALGRALYVDTRFYLPNDMLVKVDRMSMANSLEVRVPFLDENLVEFLARVPSSLKLRGFSKKKYLLKRVMQDRLPRQILHQKKQGFNIPVGLWLKTKLKPFVKEKLSHESICEMGYFDPKFVWSLLNEHFENKRDNGYQIWGLLVFRLWWERFIQRGRNEA